MFQLRRHGRKGNAQSLIDYSLLLVLIAVVSAIILLILGEQTQQPFKTALEQLDGQSEAPSEPGIL